MNGWTYVAVLVLVQATPTKQTAFLEAAEKGDVRMLSLLMRYKADALAESADGRTALEVLRYHSVGRCVFCFLA